MLHPVELLVGLIRASIACRQPHFPPGVKIKEGNNSRIQAFTGVVIARQGGGVRETFVVRKISFGTGARTCASCGQAPLEVSEAKISETAESGAEHFTLHIPGGLIGEEERRIAVTLTVPGIHNARNASEHA